jgi:hypothetical protein
MNINEIAIHALDELIEDSRRDNTPINDDDFADFVEQLIPDINEDDRIATTRLMISICDHLGIAH